MSFDMLNSKLPITGFYVSASSIKRPGTINTALSPNVSPYHGQQVL